MSKNDWFPDNEWFPGDDSSSPKRPVFRLPKVNKGLLLLGGAVLLVMVLFPALAEFYTDWLWYDTEGYGSVFLTRILARLPCSLRFLLCLGHLGQPGLVRRNLLALHPEFTPLLASKAAGWATGAVALFPLFNGVPLPRSGRWC